MLVLRLNRKENIILELPDGQKIELIHVELKKNPRIGIIAPKDIKIYRQPEVVEA